MSILVSICCITYNQEKYIEKTIESFLMQETNFRYEILIHDDASTDRTPEIIQRYVDAYPDIIKPIFQTENQYSKNVDVDYVFNFKRAQGKYIAYCEGDDYWIDPLKLQKQVDFMEEHRQVSVCIHPDKTINEKGNRIIGYRRPFKGSRYLTTADTIHLDGKFAQNSMMFVTEYVLEMGLPDWYFDSPVGDYPLLLFLSLRGKVFYMDEVMSAYRRAAANSWTERVFYVPEKRQEMYRQIASLLRSFDSYTHFRYTEAVKQQLRYNEFILLSCDKNLKEMKNVAYKKFYHELSTVSKLKLHVAYYMPVTKDLNRLLKANGKNYWFKPREVFPASKGEKLILK